MDVAGIAALEEQLRAAMVSNDLAVLDALIDESLLFVVPTGDVLGKADDLEARRSGAMRMTGLVASDQAIAVHGDSAVVTVLMDMTGDAGGVPIDGRYRYTRFWHQEPAGAWRVVGGSVTAVPVG